jgi:hypothetical protein
VIAGRHAVGNPLSDHTPNARSSSPSGSCTLREFCR